MIIGKLVRLLLKKGPNKVTKEVEEDLPSKLGKYEEDLEKYISNIKQINPELGKDSQPPSIIRKLMDKYSDKLQEAKENTPEAKRKLQQRLDNLKRIQEEEEAQFREKAIQDIEKEERRKKVRFVPKTEIIEGE
jgi:hypothetical protein